MNLNLNSLFQKAINASPEEKERQRKASEAHIREQTAKERRENLPKHVVADRGDGLRLSDYYAPLSKNYADCYNHKFVKGLLNWDKPFGVTFYGNPGTGKTTILRAFASRVMHRGGKVCFITVDEILGLLKSKDVDIEFCLKRFYKPKYLFLDDLGNEIGSEWEKKIIWRLFDYREKNQTQTFISTNLDEKALRSKYLQKTVDRIIKAAPIVRWHDYNYRTMTARNRQAEVFDMFKNS